MFSDGSQHVRATLGTYDVSLKVLDYYGGTGWTREDVGTMAPAG